MNANWDAVDLFAGPGGWDLAAAAMGIRAVGLEWDAAAVATRTAAGHATIRTDVAAYPTGPLAGIRGLIASPVCTTYSVAGAGAGRTDMPLVQQAVADLAVGRDSRAALRAECADARSLLAAEPMRFAADLRPEWVVLEQTPAALPLWRQTAEVLTGWGYSAWCGVVQAADFGVPQTRRRAVLLASRLRQVSAPVPTHCADPGVGLFAGPQPWVSMGAALADSRQVSFTVVSNYGSGGDPKARGLRTSEQPAFTLTSKWARNRLIDGDGADLPRLTPSEAGVLQGFPADYPWQGRDVALQIGNAVPPPMAAAVLSAATGIPAAVPQLAVTR
ncbi:DNA cytosine methyltransferase [Streptomyces harbinensis]|uniref:DNA cytosine methyltransferase n=1 Tax=Streptomyces harbinensis TaxID=1176198 RepID=UPI0036864656